MHLTAMHFTRLWLGTAATIVAVSPLGAQSLADRVNAVKDGTLQITYASRPDACGDGNDVTALGKLVTVYPSVQGHGWSNMNCTFGPARVVVTKVDGSITSVRVHIGAPRRASADVTDLGIVPALRRRTPCHRSPRSRATGARHARCAKASS